MANTKMALRASQWARALLVVSLSGAIGCFAGCSSKSDSSTETPGDPAERVVALQLTGHTLKVVGAYVPAPDAPKEVPTKNGLQWTFTGKDGKVLAQGRVPDTRHLESEFAANGKASPKKVALGWMLFAVRVPSVEGTFALHDSGAAGGLSPRAVTGGTSASISLGQVGASAPSLSDATALSPSPSAAPSEDAKGIQKIRTASSDCAYNILIVGDAYSDMNAFHARAAKLADDIANSPDYGPYASSFTFWTQDFISKDTSIGEYAFPKDTAFRTTFGVGDTRRAIGVDVSDGLPPATAQQLTFGIARTQANLVLVSVNSDEYGGGRSQFLNNVEYITVTNDSRSHLVVLHEMAHAALNLADEYEYGECDMSDTERINTSAKLNDLPWKDLVTNPVPTPAKTAGVGAFEGAHYCTKGVYRPADTCMMRDLGASFCPVCKRRLAEVFGAPRAAADGGVPDAGGGSDAGGGLVSKPIGLICNSKNAPIIK